MVCGLTAFGPPGILSTATSGSSSVVEHRLAKARVASSNLVSRSIPPSGASRVGYGGLERSSFRGSPARARYPSGKGEVCKTFMRRFDPDPRLQFLITEITITYKIPSDDCVKNCVADSQKK